MNDIEEKYLDEVLDRNKELELENEELRKNNLDLYEGLLQSTKQLQKWEELLEMFEEKEDKGTTFN